MNIKLPFNVEIGSKLTLIGGPCVAENWEICCEIATYLKELCQELDVNYIFKASYDKANRSSVESFRGLGMEAGLQILEDIRHELQVPVVTDIHETAEVANVAEVVDILQIPAFLSRQTDLLIAAGKTGKEVNIKKGQFLSPDAMKFAVEKVESTGNHNILLTDRGTMFGYNDLVVDFRSVPIMQKTGHPVIVDITHSLQQPNQSSGITGGNPEMISTIGKAAIAVGTDGIFLETHPNPAEALSDGANMLPLNWLDSLLYQLTQIRNVVKDF